MQGIQTPVLAVVHDGLDAQDALQLWSVFSKCKDSLQDGRRLENISWRLSFRDLGRRSALPLEPSWPPTPESVSSSDSDTKSTTTTANSAASPFFQLAPRICASSFCDFSVISTYRLTSSSDPLAGDGRTPGGTHHL
ncbi:hypothetical protein FB451DRAFT_1015217 [Mycena latifolia]|nr:hypothetical protein FB451DRAFT_1015217 [Mycena latifolia]